VLAEKKKIAALYEVTYQNFEDKAKRREVH
jgi:hypothetical protein